MTTPPQLEHPPTCVISRLRVALGTFVAIEAEAADPEIAGRGIDGAFEAIRRVERLMHPTRGTDLAALSDCAPGSTLCVHPWTWHVLRLCARLHRASSGHFDPCLSTAAGRFTDLELPAPFKVTVHAHMHLDLGGVAKGYAVDRALEALRTAGCEAGLVNAGGDLAVFGAKVYPIACAGTAGAEFIVRLRNGALATSDATQTLRPSEHRGYYHGRDRTLPVSGRVTVRAASAAVADGLTKCLLCGTDASHARLLRAFRAERIGQNARPKPRSKRVKSLFNSNH
jgi:thiamine biosynthesis lipoprotein